uniref:Uncharacterized protein n=1 Tax=Sinocyclocheilus grahami TaxID=75366 RepID=A0A672K3N4_SINGR
MCANISADQGQFSCSVCLDLLKEPVTIPCGHTFSLLVPLKPLCDCDVCPITALCTDSSEEQ